MRVCPLIASQPRQQVVGATPLTAVRGDVTILAFRANLARRNKRRIPPKPRAEPRATPAGIRTARSRACRDQRAAARRSPKPARPANTKGRSVAARYKGPACHVALIVGRRIADKQFDNGCWQQQRDPQAGRQRKQPAGSRASVSPGSGDAKQWRRQHQSNHDRVSRSSPQPCIGQVGIRESRRKKCPTNAHSRGQQQQAADRQPIDGFSGWRHAIGNGSLRWGGLPKRNCLAVTSPLTCRRRATPRRSWDRCSGSIARRPACRTRTRTSSPGRSAAPPRPLSWGRGCRG